MALEAEGYVDEGQAFQPSAAGLFALGKRVHEVANGAVGTNEVDVAAGKGHGHGARSNSAQGLQAAIDGRAKCIFVKGGADAHAHGQHAPPGNAAVTSSSFSCGAPDTRPSRIICDSRPHSRQSSRPAAPRKGRTSLHTGTTKASPPGPWSQRDNRWARR
jgi:hypothetical protein